MKWLFTILTNCYLVALVAQTTKLPFEHLSAKEGLSQSNIFSIVQDSRGFMWFASWDGLNKYDGYRFIVYKNNPGDPNSISNNYIQEVIDRKGGGLWVATQHGLNYFDRNTERFTKWFHNPSDSKSIAGNAITAIVEGSDGKLWVGTSHGLDRFDPVTNQFEHIRITASDGYQLSSQAVPTLYEDSRHQIWFTVVEEGIASIDPVTLKMRHYKHDPANPSSLAGNHVNAFFEDSRHRMWVGTNGRGLDLLDTAKAAFRHYQHDEKDPASLPKDVVLSLNEDEQQRIWVGTENGGMAMLHEATGKFEIFQHDEIDKESISNNSIYCIYRDDKNNMWLGNFAGWVDVALRDKLLFNHFKHSTSTNSLCNNQVLSIMEDSKGLVWIGTDGGGVDVFDPLTHQFTHYRHNREDPASISGNNVLCTMEDHEGNTWIGTWVDGINVMNARRKIIRRFKHNPANPSGLSSNNAWKIFQDSRHRIWVGTYGGGLNLLNPDGKSFTHFRYDPKNNASISGDNVINIFEDSNGDLWFCTESNGLNLYDPATKRFKRFLDTEYGSSVGNNTVNAIFESGNKNFWVATMNGLYQLDKKTGNYTRFTKASGLAGDYVFGILEDGHGNLWISTNHGISCLKPSTNRFLNYGVGDGVQSEEFKQLACWKSKSGMMYFGGMNGFNQFIPGDIKRVSYDPPIVMTGFSIFNKPVFPDVTGGNASPLACSITETEIISLPYSSYVFSFEFATLNYTGIEKKRYAYMLEGFDSSWTDNGLSRTVTYTHLDPGTYFFKVRGLDNDGKPSVHTRTLKLIILPPFWLTWWFKIGGLLLISGMVFLLYKLRVKEIKIQQELLKKQVKLQTSELTRLAESETVARREAEDAHLAATLANEQLKASEERYSKLFNESPQPMWAFDMESLMFVQVNRAAVYRYGYSEREFLLMNIMEIRPPEEHAKVYESVQLSKDDESIMLMSGRFRHLTKAKEILEVEIYSSPVLINNRKCRMIIAVDITEKLINDNKVTRAIIKTQEDERYQIGGELHDNVCQILVSSKMSIARIKDEVPVKVLPYYLQTTRYINLALEEIRNLSHRLAPVFFDDRPLIDTFKQLADGLNNHNQFRICFYFYPAVNVDLISRDIQLTLYRILQEQLRNMAKYSKATYVSVDLMINEQNDLVMQTTDDGIGFDKRLARGGIGLANMKRRVELFSGKLQLDTSPGNGCSITVTIPLSDRATAV